MHQIRFRPGLRPRPSWGSLQRSPEPQAAREGGCPLPKTPIPALSPSGIDSGCAVLNFFNKALIGPAKNLLLAITEGSFSGKLRDIGPIHVVLKHTMAHGSQK